MSLEDVERSGRSSKMSKKLNRIVGSPSNEEAATISMSFGTVLAILVV